MSTHKVLTLWTEGGEVSFMIDHGDMDLDE